MKTKSPARDMELLDMAVDAWEENAPTVEFGGVTLAQFKDMVETSRTIRAERIKIDNDRARNIAKREANDGVALSTREQVVRGILGDQNYGPNSVIYERFGYKRKEDYDSGLTRKKKNPLLGDENAGE